MPIDTDDKEYFMTLCPACEHLADAWLYNYGFTMHIKCSECGYDKITTKTPGGEELDGEVDIQNLRR